MIKEKVDEYFRILESTFDGREFGSSVFLTDIWKCLSENSQIVPSVQDNKNRMVIESLSVIEDADMYDAELESYYHNLCNTMRSICGKDVDEALAVGVAGLSYFGFMEGLIDLPIYNIQCNSDEACIEFLFQGNDVKQEEILPVGESTLDLVNTLRRNILTDSSLERFVKNEENLVLSQSQNLTKLIPWVPLNDGSERIAQVLAPEDFGIQSNQLVQVSEAIRNGESLDYSTSDILRMLQPDKDAVFRSFGDGNYEDNSIIGTFLTFLHVLSTALKSSVAMASTVEIIPLYKYVRSTMFELLPNRLNNKYVLLGLMELNGVIGSLEYGFFNEYSEETKSIADLLIQHYRDTTELVFQKKGICKHGVPDDMYEWMVACLRSNVLPKAAREQLKDDSLYPAIGPVRLLFESVLFSRKNETVAESLIQSEKTCESMVRSLIEAVDPAGFEPPSNWLESPVGESGAQPDSLMSALATRKVLEAVLSDLHKQVVRAETYRDREDTARVMEEQRLLLESLTHPMLSAMTAHPTIQSLMETTRGDIQDCNFRIAPYRKIKSFQTILEAAKQDALSSICETIKRNTK